ncbi:hypothetical protein, partial [uncultured Desulfovibrio sp.]|uniref:hypothetical protein n=1 Tax=uncultured Desulfovibrio sp. TaxID=167968 RepID=UPI00260F5FD2
VIIPAGQFAAYPHALFPGQAFQHIHCPMPERDKIAGSILFSCPTFIISLLYPLPGAGCSLFPNAHVPHQKNLEYQNILMKYTILYLHSFLSCSHKFSELVLWFAILARRIRSQVA